MISPDQATPFPVREDIGDDEDGIGFALRMGCRNGLAFSDLASQLASPGHRYLPHHCAAWLAFLFGTDVAKVSKALARRYVRHGTTYIEFSGYTFRKPYLVRQSHPQICPQCLSEHRHIPKLWAITIVTACPRHGTRLIDQCICGRKLSWRRPAMDVCVCGAPLHPQAQFSNQASEMEIDLASSVQERLAVTVRTGDKYSSRLPPDLLELTLSTALQVIWSFGIEPSKSCSARKKTAPNRLPSTGEASTLVQVAMRQLAIFQSQNFSEGTVPAKSVRALISLIEEPLSNHDYLIMVALFDRLSAVCPELRKALSRRAFPRQLPLFE